ncbi:uncharacterized protein EV420DRAFT_1178806 [Desarmillaria tabescens]|uniref:Uncharacterized protein n=1 Tax=Armillaria tabescens TaxID=1929756 RepID=A0AA39JC10_ARMTA|nr:uncharacterized protein EV420DRAFT_1178806 [Desarmillaria tabescens]KAK0439257.1 hypothetical protein EV420DRAFT_1178806 [Desarmillaria tabescens]
MPHRVQRADRNALPLPRIQKSMTTQQPTSNLPFKISIGGRLVPEPFLTVPQLKGHLALLRCFAELKNKVENMAEAEQTSYPQVPADKEQRWNWFVALAVERFEKWCLAKSSIERDTSEDFVVRHLPPIDVLMVWHAYQLNPARYLDDCFRIQGLGDHGDWFKIMDQVSSVYTNDYMIVERSYHWTELTGLPFDPFECAKKLTRRGVECPRCFDSLSVPLLAANGSGYIQPNFKFTCPKCSHVVTKETLAVHKLVADLVVSDATLSQTLHYSGAAALCDPIRAMQVKAAVLRSDVFMSKGDNLSPREWAVDIQEVVSYDMVKLKQHMGIYMKDGGAKLLNKIVSAYTDDKIFSLDLVGAVLRQGSFTAKMRRFGWYEPDFFARPEDELALKHCIARYHAFLDLMSSKPKEFFVPTLDIDLAWHTHQLLPSYNEDCISYLRRSIDHDDNVKENVLSSAFDKTCLAWGKRYNIRYTPCGCSASGTSTGEKLSGQPLHYLIPPDDRSDSDLVASAQGQGTEEEGRRADLSFLAPVPLYIAQGTMGACGGKSMLCFKGQVLTTFRWLWWRLRWRRVWWWLW